MSSADPTDAVSPKDILSKSPRAKARLGSEPAVAASEDADVRSEKPQQPRPEERKTDPKKPEADQPAEQGPKGIVGAFRKHPITMIVCFGLIVIGVVAGVVWYLHARHYESTDDAFIDGRPVLVSPEVGGSIVSVDVTDNQIVKKGDLLATIDRRNYQAALQQANGLVAQNEATAKNIDAQITAQTATIEQAGQQVTQAQAALKFSTDENNRYQDLMQKGAGTVQRAQQASSDLTSKQAALEAATAAKLAAERQIDVLDAQKIGASAQLEQAEAQRDRAVADLQRTELRATVDGRVTKLTAAVGALAAPGQSIMVVVPLDIWVTANFEGAGNLPRNASRSACRYRSRRIRPNVSRSRRQRSGGKRHRLQPAAGGKRHRQLCESGATHTSQDHLRPAARRRARTGHVGGADRQTIRP